jgi:hypothetical protein
MRAQEFLAEELVRANDLEHLRNRAKLIVRLIEPIAEHPLVYREFSHNIGAETALLKVNNTDRAEFKARSGSNSKQPEVLRALGITNPVFCTMQTPYTTDGFFGGANIFVPGADYRVVWSPVVKDLGGNDIVGPNADQYGHEDLGGGVSRLGSDRLVGAEFANTYRSGWPTDRTSNELIFDCKTYYLLNIKDFLRRFAGKQNRDIVYRRDRINQEVFNAKFSTYGDIAWYLSNTLPGYLDWYEANVLNKSPEAPVTQDIAENFADGKVLDPEIYGEELPVSTVKRIVVEVINQVDPGAKVSVKQSPEGYYIVRGEKLRLDFGITADGGDISANVVNAYSSYKGAGVVTKIFAQCFQAAEQLWGKPTKFVVSVQQDRGDGVWQAISKKLGAEWGGSVMENFADGKNPQDKGDSVRHGIPKGATMAQLEKASHAKGRKGQLARWQLNMRRGKKK